MKKIITLLCLIGLFGCGQKHQKTDKHKVSCYKTHTTNDDGTTSLLYWYLIWGSNNSCYYYSSPTPVSNYSSVSWQSSNSNPISSFDSKSIEEEPVQIVSEEQLSGDMQTVIDENPENFEGMTQEEMGDYESDGTVPSNETESSTQSTTTESNSSDNGGDSGGGDSGGGE